ncbi:MAG: nucleotidyltransferase family protein [Candidatus Marinimicrobia bacterium]|jgi:glucose-1-phosphate thymidylyltransferase|nr:nucleotidyltransferase family protein [Candidatus Neomarinimicrobiota bacterium]MDP6593689.1 nucleotidyltransferase family protein [Candidatus Neomarinimicrobiota bacterium]MDP6836366.1 nucleotidyltransferase family protein [Candidatus Neomarinimicrobiota bacterium]MDP6967215.1 nucleotidyltransferase family protein [Candidatus Neomarinimicrobiota bacterium]|tara:strand:- start:18828 stop:19727 length:900 start_codon:yes stop_codon:yes gene_type:complete
MKVIIPVAGLGSRLLPHTKRRQKCLLPVAGKPVLDHIIDPFVAQDFDEIVLVTGHLEDQLRDYVNRFDAEFTFVRQKKALGLGHAIFQGLKEEDSPVMIQLGDVIYDIDFTRFCSSGKHKIAVDEVPDPERFGIVEIENEIIKRVLEKPENPPTNLAIVGLYYLESQKPLWQAIKHLMDHNITTKGEIQLADAFQMMIESGEIIAYEKVSSWFDCGVPETFLSTNRALLSPGNSEVEGSQIIEPVSMGEDCTIVNSTVGPYVTLMNGSQIINSEISDAIVLWNGKVENTVVRHAIVPEG